jgi:predicted DNA-binding transcriptional regulator AlpA
MIIESSDRPAPGDRQRDRPDPPPRRLIDARETGRVLGCSWRTVYRLADAGRIPPGYKLNALRRWDLAEIEAFIAGGCKPPRATTKWVR